MLDVGRRGFYDRAAPPDLPGAVDSSEFDDVLSKIFTWWNGATIGTLFTVGKRGQQVGTDEFGNRYYESRDTVSYDGRKRRWVIYDGYAEATKVPPEWQGWLRYTYDGTPAGRPLPRCGNWPRPNSGTPAALHVAAAVLRVVLAHRSG